MDKNNHKDNRFYLSRKFIGIVTLFIIAGSLLVVLTNFAINMTSVSGDYMRIMSSWNQYHYQTAALLESFAESGKQSDYRKYMELTEEMDKQARLINELFQKEPDVGMIYESLSSEHIYPNEISSLVFAFQQFRDTKKMQTIFQQWKRMREIQEQQNKKMRFLAREWNSGKAGREELSRQTADIDKLNQAWNLHNRQLTAHLADGFGVIKQTGLWLSVILGILLVLIGILVTVRANKSVGRWENILNEKEILLLEIHHRVKNNLAVISGLLEFESMNNPQLEQVMKDSQDRIQSMAMIHEILYRSDSFSEINLGQYLKNLVKYIADRYNCDKKDMQIKLQAADVILNVNQAVPVGLILNEMLVHTITRSSNGRCNRKIELHLSEKDGRVSLSIKDNEDGLPMEFRNKKSGSTSVMIAETLIQQLEAKVTYNNGSEKVLNLKFQKSDAPGSSNAVL